MVSSRVEAKSKEIAAYVTISVNICFSTLHYRNVLEWQGQLFYFFYTLETFGLR